MSTQSSVTHRAITSWRHVAHSLHVHQRIWLVAQCSRELAQKNGIRDAGCAADIHQRQRILLVAHAAENLHSCLIFTASNHCNDFTLAWQWIVGCSKIGLILEFWKQSLFDCVGPQRFKVLTIYGLPLPNWNMVKHGQKVTAIFKISKSVPHERTYWIA